MTALTITSNTTVGYYLRSTAANAHDVLIANGASSESYRHRRRLPSWPGLSGPPIPAPAAIGGPDKPGHDD